MLMAAGPVSSGLSGALVCGATACAPRRCLARQQAVKQMSIARLPPVLALHIKRFEAGAGFVQVLRPRAQIRNRPEIFFCAVRVSPRILQTAVPRARRFAKAQRRHSAIGNCEHALPRPGTAGTRGPRRVAPSGSARKLGLSTSNASRQLAGDFQVLFSLCAESTSSSRGEQCAYECLSGASLDCSECGSCGCMAS